MGDTEAEERPHLTPAQIHQLMSVIAGMDAVKEAGAGAGAGLGSSPPPSDEEIQQFLAYVGCGQLNTQRAEYEAERQQLPEPPRRNKQACQYFWRRHYLSIIQEADEEAAAPEHPDTPAASRPASTYENNLSRLSRVIGALSPGPAQEVRGSWGSERSVESMTSINSILSEEGSITSNGSFESSDRPLNPCDNADSRRAAPGHLSSLLEAVHPPSNTPDSMLSCESPSIRLSRADSDIEDSVSNVAKFRMGNKFKQSIHQIEELKRKEGDFCPAEDAGLRGDGGLEAAEAVQGDPVLAAAEAQGAEVVGDLEPASSSPHLRPEPSQARRDLTISTLIAECEEYVNTDEFTKDLSDKLVHLFSKNKTNPSQKVSTENNLETTTASVKVMESTRKLDKPPKIPGKLRTKVAGKQDRAERERVAAPAPKFPVSGLRTSLYENTAGGGGGGGAGDSEVEDEGIDNDYDEAADTEPGEAGAKHETSPALASEGYDSAHESDKKLHLSEVGVDYDRRATPDSNRNEIRKEMLNPFLNPNDLEKNSSKEVYTNRNPFEVESSLCPAGRLNPFVGENDGSSSRSLAGSLADSDTEEEITIANSNENFEDYESVISDIEETLSVLSRNSRSTTPASRTPTPSFGQINYFGGDTGDNSAVADKHIIPIVTVFDDLKDYLSDSDLSLEYQIARQRRRQKNMKNLNKQKAQLSNILTSKNKLMGQQERVKLPDEEKNTRDKAKEDKFLSEDRNNPFKSPSCSNIFQNAFESQETSLSSKIVVNKKNAETVKNDKNYVNTAKLANEQRLGLHKDNNTPVTKINSSSVLKPSIIASKVGTRKEDSSKSIEAVEERCNDDSSLGGIGVNVKINGGSCSKSDGTSGFNSGLEDCDNSVGPPCPRNPWRIDSRTETESTINNTNSLKYRKQAKTDSFVNRIENLTEKNKPTNSSQNNKPLCNGFAKSFSNVFHESSISPPKQYSSCFAERTSVSDYASRNSEKSIHANYGLRSFQSADENTDRNNKQYRSLPRLAKSSSENSNMSFNKIGTFNIKSNGVLSRSASADMKPSMSSISRKGSHHEQVKIKSPGSQKRSSSAEPEFLRFWMEKDRAVSASTNNIEQDVCGVYYAAPCITLDSDQDSDSDDCTDDAATVIFKSSPYSSPAPGPISRSASLTMTPCSPSPGPVHETSPPPPRPPPPTNYVPSVDTSSSYCSLPRNWRERKKFLFNS